MTLIEATREAAKRLNFKETDVADGERSVSIKFPGSLKMEIPPGQEEAVIQMIMGMAVTCWTAPPDVLKSIDDFTDAEARKLGGRN